MQNCLITNDAELGHFERQTFLLIADAHAWSHLLTSVYEHSTHHARSGIRLISNYVLSLHLGWRNLAC